MNVLPIAAVVIVLSPVLALGQVTADAVPAPLAASPSKHYIPNIAAFLQQCPDRDPAYAEIKRDFEVRRNDKTTAEPVCTEPISAMTTAQYTDELIARQGLRVIYYMDRGQSGHLPWTPGSLYDWMKSRIQGIDIIDGVVGGYCCATLDGKLFFVAGNEDGPNRDADRTWSGLAGNIAFYAHEVRHTEGDHYLHSSCCGIANGCDNAFDPNNLSAYAVQWWLYSLWLNGTINVGYGCQLPSVVSSTTIGFVDSENLQYAHRFCTNPPPTVTAPAVPFGACPAQPRRQSAKK
jgi:hypothetical protein